MRSASARPASVRRRLRVVRSRSGIPGLALEAGDRLAHGRGGQPLPARRGAKAAGVGHGEEEAEIVERGLIVRHSEQAIRRSRDYQRRGDQSYRGARHSRRNDMAEPSAAAAGRFTFAGTSIWVNRMGYGAMQLAGPHVFGPPKDPDEARAVLREAWRSASTTSTPATTTGPMSPTG